jgi:hypothetical protein
VALISVALSESLILRLHAGWRPFAGKGFYVDAGYTLATLGGDASTAEVLEEASGAELDTREGSRLDNEFDIASTLHLIDVELGWDWVLGERWTLRAALAYAGTLAASTTVTALFTPQAPALTDAFEEGVATYLDDIYTSYVHTAVITLAFGFRFAP